MRALACSLLAAVADQGAERLCRQSLWHSVRSTLGALDNLTRTGWNSHACLSSWPSVNPSFKLVQTKALLFTLLVPGCSCVQSVGQASLAFS